MPNAFGRLSEEDRDKIRQWLDGKSKTSCPHCQRGTPHVDDFVVQVPARADTQSPGFTMMMVAVVCRMCAFIRFFDARAIGVVPS